MISCSNSSAARVEDRHDWDRNSSCNQLEPFSVASWLYFTTDVSWCSSLNSFLKLKAVDKMKFLVLLSLLFCMICVNGKSRRGYWSSFPRKRFGDRRNFKVGEFYKTGKDGNRIEQFDHNLPYRRSSSSSNFYENNLTTELTSSSLELTSTTLSSSSTKELKYANIANDQKKRLKKILVPLPRHIAGYDLLCYNIFSYKFCSRPT